MKNYPNKEINPLGHELVIAADETTKIGDTKLVMCQKCSFSKWGEVTNIYDDGTISVKYDSPTEPCNKGEGSKSNIDNKELVTC